MHGIRSNETREIPSRSKRQKAGLVVHQRRPRRRGREPVLPANSMRKRVRGLRSIKGKR